MSPAIDRLVTDAFQLAECPTWDEKRCCLLWADIQGHAIHELDWATGKRRKFDFDNEVGSFGLADDGRLIVAIWDRVVLFDMATGEETGVARIEEDLPQTRLNDGKVGPDGAFWVGTMDTSSPREPIAGLYRVTADGTVARIAEDLYVSNGLAWSPDGTIMYHSDSTPGWIDAYDFDATSGAVSNRRRFAQQQNDTGRPDGATVDADGTYWSAGVSAGVLNRFTPDGTCVETIKVPVPKPTMPCFCGPDLRTLVLTSLQAGPIEPGSGDLSGSIFTIETAAKGLAGHRFKTGG